MTGLRFREKRLRSREIAVDGQVPHNPTNSVLLCYPYSLDFGHGHYLNAIGKY